MIKKKKLVALKCFYAPETQKGYPILTAFRKHPNVEMVPIQELGNASPDIILNCVSFVRDSLVEVPFLKKSSAIYVINTGEAMLMRPRIYDWAFSYEPTTKYNFRLGLSIPVVGLAQLEQRLCRKYSDDFLNSLSKHEDKTKFCHFIYGNSCAIERVLFTKKLMQYKRVDCLGDSLNNSPKIPRADFLGEMNIAKDYKFGIAFENHLRLHYTTEKIYKCFMAGVVPIYWGNPKVSDLINPESFINCHDFKNFDAAIKHVIEVDNNPELYARYLHASPILPESRLRQSGPEFLNRRVEQIIDSVGKKRPVATYPTYRLRHQIWLKRNFYYQKIHVLSISKSPLISSLLTMKRLQRRYRANGRFM